METIINYFMTYANRYNPQLSNLNPVLGEIQSPSSHQQFERKNLTFPIRVLQTKIRSLSACVGYEACFWTHRDCPCREAARLTPEGVRESGGRLQATTLRPEKRGEKAAEEKKKDGAEKGGKAADKKDEQKEVELSEEDMALKENLELMVVRSADPKAGVAKLAMETMRSEIKSATR